MTVAVYRYRVTDKPGWLTLIDEAKDGGLAEVRRHLEMQFGARMVAVEEAVPKTRQRPGGSDRGVGWINLVSGEPR